MKKFLGLVLLLLPFYVSSQINIEEFTHDGYYSFCSDSSGSIYINVVNDSTVQITSVDVSTKYTAVCTSKKTLGKLAVSQFSITDSMYFSSIIIWENLNLVYFEYHSGGIVINSGPGVNYKLN